VSARGLIVAASHSAAGKTTVTLALLAALARRGIAVRAAKAGPDYIDPAFHAAATGSASVNLDSWAMPPSLLNALAAQATASAEIFVIEGVMGLFDGIAGPPGRGGTTADLAAHFRLPVLLVLDVSGQAQSAAAVVRGFASHDPAVRIGGVILNRVGSARHHAVVAAAIAPLHIPVLGAVPRDEMLALPSRHLGLVQADEHTDLAARFRGLAEMAERCLDLDAILALAASLSVASASHGQALPPPGQRIALASDAAFSFIYPHIVEAWRRAGAEIVPFSPLADEPPPERCDNCWLPGGYPELHADALAAAHRFKAALRRFAETRPVHGECGGYMVLGESIEDAAGRRHPMTRLLGQATSFAKRKLHLGYREARLLVDSPLGSTGSTIRGHEFHYATLEHESSEADEPLAELFDGTGQSLGRTGGRRGLVTGTFFHAIAGANPS
jgi:cobyrinic acid a,c-diamide synthase